MAMATYSGQNYGAGKPERIWMGVKASALMMIVYWAFTFCVLMFGARTFALLFVDASELEILKNTELFLHISVSFFRFWDCSASCDTLSRGWDIPILPCFPVSRK